MSVIESPCVNICVIDRREDLCVGCYRSLEEIATWGTMSPAERQAVMERLPNRKQRIKVKRDRERNRDRLED
ncbi:DUF1289 domain-containing protein [Paracoccus sp. 11-3]|uniref:DUF1289 domain-containing protein n=1 Tax=Paracoccus amoyensis TaxID=2760093 RepID=A0A926GDX6_9RHOB|nr:DUF1289 domain-containing protein [Paracoccus amoyensis]MBC9247365.1 DUF1289 domain-containing protein [Paracoccus amoyensis]